ncbi:hypothetical protein ES703_02631 [subsurface metagenome]
MSEEKKPQKILLEVTIPTKDSVVAGLMKLFPTLEVRVIEEEKDPEEP